MLYLKTLKLFVENNYNTFKETQECTQYFIGSKRNTHSTIISKGVNK